MVKKYQIGIIGSAGLEEYKQKSKPAQEIYAIAYELGKLVAQNNAILITGGKGGIMDTAAKGAKENGGITVGVISGNQRFLSNKYTDVEIVTGMYAGSDAAPLVMSCDGLIGIGGGAGTLQELTIAYRCQIPVVLIPGASGWSNTLAGKYMDERQLQKFKIAKTPAKAVKMLFKLIKSK